MKKAATIMSWLIIVFEALYLVAVGIATLINMGNIEGRIVLNRPELSGYLQIYHLLRVLIPVVCVTIAAIVLLVVSAFKSKKIVFEVGVIIVFSGIAAILLIPFDAVYMSLINARINETTHIYLSHYLTTSLNAVSVLHMIPMVMLPVAAACSIVHKKYVKM